MTMHEKAALIEQEPILGYWSTYGGIEVHKIEYGIEDRLWIKANAWYGKPKYHMLRIYYGDRDYIVFDGHKLYLDECIKEGF